MDSQIRASSQSQITADEAVSIGDRDESELAETRSLTPSLPVYANACHFLRIMNGVPYTLFRRTSSEIYEHAETLKSKLTGGIPMNGYRAA